MKITKIYANTQQFKPITFKDGFNVIYGDVVAKPTRIEGKPHEHNIGKTSLAKLIDFMLLKKTSSKDLFVKHEKKFVDWVFYMEIKLNSGKYVTVRRGVAQNTKISFKEHFSENQDFTKEGEWNYIDLSLHSQLDDANPTKILNDYLAFDVLPSFNYRSSLGYFLRDQDSYRQVFEIDKFAKSVHSDWKPMVFELLGFNPRNMIQKYELDNHKKDDEKYISRLQLDQESDEVYRIREAIEAKKRDRDDLKAKSDSFNFFEQEQGINVELVQETEVEIASLNKKEYKLNYDIEQIQESLDSATNITVDFDEIKKLFGESEIYFSESLAQDYESVVRFSEQITSERNKYLLDELKEAQLQVKEIKARLSELNQKRASALSLLGEKDTFIKYKAYQNELVRVETEIAKYEAQLENARTIESYTVSLEKTKDEIKHVSDQLREQIDEGSDDKTGIATLFQSLFKTIMGYTALLVVQPNKTNGNIEFDTSVLDDAQDLTGQGDGHTAHKALCASFVMAILAHYSKRSFFRFTYLDGVLESWGNNPKDNFLEMARSYAKQYDIQLIISVIKSDIPATFEFEEDEVRRKLSENDRLFGMTL
jgi:uncharacterized protein YydD (DUF2326 family)